MISVTWHLQYFFWVCVNWVRHMRNYFRLITPPNTILGVLHSASLLSAAQTQTYVTHVEGCHVTSVPSCTSIICQYLNPAYSRVLRNCKWILIAFTNWNVLVLLSCYRAGRFLGCLPMLFETASLFAVSMLLPSWNLLWRFKSLSICLGEEGAFLFAMSLSPAAQISTVCAWQKE